MVNPGQRCPGLSQSLRLHNLLASSSAADVLTETHLRRRNEDLQERVKRFIAENRTLRACVKLDELEPDTLVLVAEGNSSLVVAACLGHLFDLSCFLPGLSTGKLDWGLLNLSDETRVVSRDALKAADASRSADEVADSIARAAFQVSALPSKMAPKAQAAETRRTSPGTSSAEAHDTTSKRKAPPSSAAPARMRLHGRLRVLDDDSDSESNSGGHTAFSDTSTPQRRNAATRPDPAPVVPKARPLPPSDSSARAPSPPRKRSSPRSRDAFAARSRATSRVVLQASIPVRGGVISSSQVDSHAARHTSRFESCRVLDLSGAASQPANLAPPVPATPLAAPNASAAGSVLPFLLTTSLQEAQDTLASQSSRSVLSSDVTVATIVLSDGEVEVEDSCSMFSDLVAYDEHQDRDTLSRTALGSHCYSVSPSLPQAKSNFDLLNHSQGTSKEVGSPGEHVLLIINFRNVKVRLLIYVVISFQILSNKFGHLMQCKLESFSDVHGYEKYENSFDTDQAPIFVKMNPKTMIIFRGNRDRFVVQSMESVSDLMSCAGVGLLKGSQDGSVRAQLEDAMTDVEFVPPGTTILAQPMDVAVMAGIKSGCRGLYINSTATATTSQLSKSSVN
ncbi:unnamed protein product [Phytophthora fragariaefolia]|uniref:Unnamed protein product n=1 Tax=Phytophthora fragariaefolia TaxID=1490495 RepID=A0A9W7D0K5_9STRA|nr:unnamed protein product [Phytophthora fragariaefolia]